MPLCAPLKVHTPPVRNMCGHQCVEQFAVTGDSKMQQRVDDHEVLKAVVANLRETTGQHRDRIYRFDHYVDILDAGWTERKKATENRR